MGRSHAPTPRAKFHFQDVDAGTYIVSASPPKTAAPEEDEDGRKLGWARTWYPSASDAAGAARVVIAAGADLVGEDIELGAVPVFRVSGRVVNVDGEPMKGVAVKAMPPEEFDAAQFQRQATSQADGSFEIGGLADGNWRFTAEAVAGGVQLYAGLEETVAGHDVERIELRFAAPFTLTGKVVRSATATPAETKEVGVMLTPKEGGYHMLVGQDG